MKRVFLSVLLGMLLSLPNTAKAQQAPLISQYMFNTLYINPAYAGYKGDFYAHSFFRSQWIGMSGAPQTIALGADMGVAEEHVGLGLVLMTDRQGFNRTNSFMSNYAYWIKLNDKGLRLSFGLAAGAINYTVDGADADPNDWNDPMVPASFYSIWMPEASAGAYLSNDRFYAGFSAMNMLSRYLPIKGEYEKRVILRNYTEFMLTAGLLLPLSDQFDLKPSFLIKEDFNSPTNVDLNAMLFIAKTVWAGVSYRMNITAGKDYTSVNSYQSSALTLLVEVYATEDLRIGYSYDFDFGEISKYSGGNHEISVGYNFSGLSKSKGRRKIQKMRYF